jgi:hypothetical protein
MKPEKKLKQKILKYLKTLPESLFFTVEQRPGQQRGCSDILGIFSSNECPGRFVAIEVKIPGNKTTPLQDLFLKKVAEAHGLAFVAYSVEDVQNIVEMISKVNK